MDRRRFLVGSSALAVNGPGMLTKALAEDVPALRIGGAGAVIPRDFVGLSYETQQLSDPAFFSAANTALIPFFRTLSPCGVLRLGGNTSANSWWKARADATAPVFRNSRDGGVGTTSAKLQFAVTPAAILGLRDFLDATGWSCIYGLNLANGTPQAAAEEAQFVSQTLGDRLLYLQVGNEVDLFDKSVRPPGWTIAQYCAEWLEFARAIVAKVPQARFSAPDAAVHTEWISGFAKRLLETPNPPAVAAMTHHYYAGGPPADPKLTFASLLAPDERVAKDAGVVREAAGEVRARYRLTEANTCYHGGKPGVSDVFASALWAAKYALTLAAFGYAGLNLHGGGGRQVADSLGGKLPGEDLLPPHSGWHASPFYTPIATGPGGSLQAQPVYYGLLLMDHFSGCTLLDTSLSRPLPDVAVYAARGDGAKARGGKATRIAVLNWSEQPVTLQVPAKFGLSMSRLEGDGLAGRNVRLGGAQVSHSGTLAAALQEQVKGSKAGMALLTVPAASGVLAYLS